ncbi:MAG TPA: glycosyltransferase family 39 protein [Candidatus Acidoferrales bacterium]|nr:glycosyltransferase family 39 protein [Candidatus Acidoferrales bacterium]
MLAGTTSTTRGVNSAASHPSGTQAVFHLLPLKHLVAAILLGFALRFFFIIHFPFYAGDTKFYDELARNWLDHGVYGLFVHGQLTPVDMRMPGYPAFLAGVYAVFGRSGRAVMLVQALVDLITCVLTALIAARIAPPRSKIRVATIALWMAALCPFTANYSAAVLTESLATFLTTLAVFTFVTAFDRTSADPPNPLGATTVFTEVRWWLLTGALVGVGTLVRPETPLLLLAAGVVLAVHCRHRKNWPRLFLAVAWMSAGLLLALAPWAARNARTMGRIEFLAPRYAETYGDFIPRGFYAWTGTWMVRFKEAYLVTWKLGKEPIRIDDLPATAFDSNAERARAEDLLVRYNSNLQMTPALDRGFDALARERTERQPIRTYIEIPLARMWAMWFTPRIALLPYSGGLWPPAEMWRNNRTDFSVTLGFGVLNFAYAVMALLGALRFRREPRVAFLVTFILIRTMFLTQLQTVEPRYVIVCYPLVLILAALAWVPQRA